MNIEIPNNIDSAETAKRALHQLAEQQRELHRSNQDLRKNLDEKLADLALIQRQLVEAQARPMERGQAPVDDFIRRGVDGPAAVRWRGEDTDDGWMPGLLDADAPSCGAWHNELQAAVEQRSTVALLLGPQRAQKTTRRLARLLRKAPEPIAKAFSQDIDGAGQEWVQTVTFPQLERELMGQRIVASLFKEMPMSAKSLRLPFLNANSLRPHRRGAVTSDTPGQFTPSSPSTDERTFTADSLVVRLLMDDDTTEDAVVDSQGLFRQLMVETLRDGYEDAVINGDTAASHQDAIASWNPRSRWPTAGAGAATDHRRSFVGLRARAFDVSNTLDQSAAQSAAGFLALRKTLAAPHNLRESVCLTSAEYLLTLMGLEQVLTVDKFGPMATIKSGQLAALYGVPIIPTDFMTSDLAASGLYTGSGAKTSLLLLDASRFYRFVRRGARVELSRDITRGVVEVVATERGTFGTIDSATKKNVALSINLG